MNHLLLALALLTSTALSATAAAAADKPIVYNPISGETTAINQQVSNALAPQCILIDLRDSADYVQPKPTAGSLPRVARAPTGEYIGGYVLIAYVVTAAGQVGSPTVLKTDDARLDATALQAMSEWRFTPATLKGVPISSTSAQEFHFEAPPTEFVQQVLEPTGGKITKPKDWFYSEAHQGPKYEWAITREDMTGGKPYTTGVRIQSFTGIKEGAGKTAQQFILDFVAKKKLEPGVKVIKSCGSEDQGLFTRTCLEIEEGPYHVLYSLFWGSQDMDVAVVMIAGTLKEMWPVYYPAFDKMRSFEFIDVKRFEK